MKVTMGLDFGTTNSALALLEKDKVRVVNISNRESSERTLRSVLFLDEERNVSVGQQAIDRYIEHDGTHGRFMQSLKALLPMPDFKEANIFGRRYELEELIALILSEIKYIGEKWAGRAVDRVVLGRPVFFSNDPRRDKMAQERLHLAALRSGFSEVSFELEPVGATLAYLLQMQGVREEVVLMGDFGGGTSDFTVMKLHPKLLSEKHKQKNVLSVGGIYVGGDSFDSRIMWEKITPYFGRDITYVSATGQTLNMPAYIVRTICKWHIIPFLREQKTLQALYDIRRTANHPRLVQNLEDLILENKGFQIFQAIERAKKELSSEIESRLIYQGRGLTIEEMLGREEFEKFITPDLADISRCVSDTIADSGLSPSGIDKVLLTGGSSFVPAVRRIFEEMFGPEKIVYLDAFTSVAHGLALSAMFR